MIRKGKWCETYRTSFHYDTVVGFEIDIDAVVYSFMCSCK